MFTVHYFDDPDDGEQMWSEELFQYVLLTQETVQFTIIFIHTKHICRWLVPANHKLDAGARRRYDSDDKNEPAQWDTKAVPTKQNVATASSSTTGKKNEKEKQFRDTSSW